MLFFCNNFLLRIIDTRYKKKILELAEQHDKASEIEKVQRYAMPSEKGELQTYLEEDLKEKVPRIQVPSHLCCTKYLFSLSHVIVD